VKNLVIFVVIQAAVTALLYGLIAATETEPTVLFGMPVIGSSMEAPSWITTGGQGVIVLGAGVGLVEFGMYGVGILFATGQACAGLIAFGQAAFGLLFFCAQLGLGFTGLGQLAIGIQVIGQGELGPNGAEFFTRMNTDLNALLRFRSAPPAAP
jgi:hypothetical protein